ncbi:DUF2071 domain-containing protein [Sphingobacterium deserti]|uniref:DUF2071 domain-containing protein n=1 Tax=Sphingobacterium deserti TaxID=1229276 RepID=A0A0B8T7J4_9SPHI|nr:DUF2071 domain-containing protein [Sphingobacterium deserti]KGE14464.1 hypothetical protein DI53_1493 [Sphingobacterium deserti]
MNFLKNHPFAVEAFFDSSLVFTFAVPKEQLEKFIPAPLTLDLYQDKWAFIAVAMVQTRGLRPKGFPRFFGNDFFLIGYRIFVRYTNNDRKRLRGLYIIKSETDTYKMELLGNVFSRYNYTTTDIQQDTASGIRTIHSKRSCFSISIDTHNELASLPKDSPFTDWKDARKFAGPLPFTFSSSEKDKLVLIVEGVRQGWIPKPIDVIAYKFDFLDRLNLKDVVLANAFEIENVPYYWKKGKTEVWK